MIPVASPGWLPAGESPSPEVVRALRRAHSRGARVVSICSGVFALAHEGVSTRTLTRRFADRLGTSPGQWLLAQRIAVARDLLESSDLPLDTVARRVGLSSATNLRRRFLNTLGTTPGAYRRTFRAGPR